jgi:hypothetical protein
MQQTGHGLGWTRPGGLGHLFEGSPICQGVFHLIGIAIKRAKL